MHEVLGNVEEVTRSGVDGSGAAGAELDPNGAVDDVHGGVVVAVVVPAGRHPGVTAYQPGPESVDVDGLLAHLARCRVSDATVRGMDAGDLGRVAHRSFSPFAVGLTGYPDDPWRYREEMPIGRQSAGAGERT